jgi:FMN reductase
VASDPVLIINGSPSSPSRTGALCDHLARELTGLGLPSQNLVLRDLPAEALIRGQADADGIKEAVALVQAARAIALVTPIYKAAYSGLTKVFLDLLPQFAFNDKLVLPLATAGSPAHVLALDYALRPVLASLGVRHAAAGFVVLERQLEVSPDGVRLDAEAAQKLRPILEAFVDSVRRHAT